MQVAYFQVAAFTPRNFAGNPAGVCLLPNWPSDLLLQQIASENNLSETAFLVPEEKPLRLRWFTPKIEMDLCGHATLAAAHVLYNEQGWPGSPIEFHSKSGVLPVARRDSLIELDFPSRPAVRVPELPSLVEALGKAPQEIYKARDLMAIFGSQDEVIALDPDQGKLSALDTVGIIVTAPGEDCDFVSRFFAPRAGVPEDPVTGSSHCTLIPFWAERLGKQTLFARQVSRRGGELHCRLMGDRVGIAGQAVVYSKGFLQLPEF